MKRCATAKKTTMNEQQNPASNRRQGHLFVLSAPSGGGKTTLCRAVRDRFADIRYSISYTTRRPRPGEIDGLDYVFITENEFKDGIAQGRWAEWAQVHGNYYGTSAEFLNRELAAQRDILLDIDVQGACQIVQRYPQSVTIFIMPPSLDVLRQRLEARGTDSTEAIKVRLQNAAREMVQKNAYRHVIINDRLPQAIEELIELIESYRQPAAAFHQP
jgi:guanylate kinase